MIKVGVLGARGRMGTAVCQAVEAASDLELAVTVDQGDDRQALALCDAVVDFTAPGEVLGNLEWCIGQGLNMVVGTSGFSPERLETVAGWLDKAPDVRVMIAANFSVGAVLMMQFAAQAAGFFESAEIIELHHANKVVAPSGTAARPAAGLGEVPDATPTAAEGARGALQEGVHVHSVRLPGLVAHQEVLLGGHGETLTIRHDSLDRASFMPGVLLAVRKLASLPPGLTFGLENLLGLT